MLLKESASESGEGRNDSPHQGTLPNDTPNGRDKATDTLPSDEEASAEDSPRKGVKNADKTKLSPTSRSWSSTCFPEKKVVKCGRDLGVHEICLEDRANCLSKWLLFYLNPLLKLGSTKVLDEDDIGVPPRKDVAATAYTKSLAVWTAMSQKIHAKNEQRRLDYEAKLARCATEEQRQKIKEPIYQEPSIAWALVKSFGGWELFVGLLYYVASALLTFVPVIILRDLLKFFQSGLSVDEYDGLIHPWVGVVGLGVVPFLVSLLQTRHQTIYAHCAVFVRTAVSTMLYRKALRVSAAGRAKTSTGQVVNMMSNDTAQLQRFLQFVGMTMVAPLQIVIALVLIHQQVRLFERPCIARCRICLSANR
jgi:ABC transporter transmembrane region